MMRKIVSLNGLWDYKVGCGEYHKHKVPFSVLTVGDSECRKVFDKPNIGERYFLVFEGITYWAEVILNGVRLGEMLAYGEYRFEVTQLLKEKGNELVVKLEDIHVPFGPSEGWENYGGIMRDVYLECTGQYVISDAFWHTDLNLENQTAKCTVEITSDCPDGTVYECYLYDQRGQIYAQYATEDQNIVFDVKNPELWSPDTPYLYTLYIKAGEEEISFKVGFKLLEKRGRVFYLNGEKLLFFGVCRHDIYGDNGHVADYVRMREDMENIKNMGANFVRLVHYPHNRKILEIADELGLMVSEEPGLWWSDMNNREICDGALTILRNVIIRDRSHVSVAFWLSFNECVFTEEFLLDSARTAREADPTRMISGANCMSLEMTKELFKKCGFDFYTLHPYTEAARRFYHDAEALDDMPLFFTEWGGYYTYDCPRFLNECMEALFDLYQQEKLAGAAYWEWAEIYEFHRGTQACVDGVLKESLVDFNGKHTLAYDTFQNALKRLHSKKTFKYSYNIIPIRRGMSNCRPIDLNNVVDDEERKAMWDRMVEVSKIRIPKFYYKMKAHRKMTNGPVLYEAPEQIGDLPVKLLSQPLTIDKSINIPIHDRADQIYFIGNVSMPYGYPTYGQKEEPAAVYTICYEDGTQDNYIMKNAVDITTACVLYGPSRINPICPGADRVIEFSYDLNWEHYIINSKCISVNGEKQIKNIRLDVQEGYNLLLYGITLAHM